MFVTKYVYILPPLTTTEAERPFYEHSRMGSTRNTETTVSYSAILSCKILNFGLQLSVCVDGFSECKATEWLASWLRTIGYQSA